MWLLIESIIDCIWNAICGDLRWDDSQIVSVKATIANFARTSIAGCRMGSSQVVAISVPPLRASKTRSRVLTASRKAQLKLHRFTGWSCRSNDLAGILNVGLLDAIRRWLAFPVYKLNTPVVLNDLLSTHWMWLIWRNIENNEMNQPAETDSVGFGCWLKKNAREHGQEFLQPPYHQYGWLQFLMNLRISGGMRSKTRY